MRLGGKNDCCSQCYSLCIAFLRSAHAGRLRRDSESKLKNRFVEKNSKTKHNRITRSRVFLVVVVMFVFVRSLLVQSHLCSCVPYNPERKLELRRISCWNKSCFPVPDLVLCWLASFLLMIIINPCRSESRSIYTNLAPSYQFYV